MSSSEKVRSDFFRKSRTRNLCQRRQIWIYFFRENSEPEIFLLEIKLDLNIIFCEQILSKSTKSIFLRQKSQIWKYLFVRKHCVKNLKNISTRENQIWKYFWWEKLEQERETFLRQKMSDLKKNLRKLWVGNIYTWDKLSFDIILWENSSNTYSYARDDHKCENQIWEKKSKSKVLISLVFNFSEFWKLDRALHSKVELLIKIK